MSMLTEVGRSRLYTQRDRARRTTGILVALAGAMLAAWIGGAVAALLAGHGLAWPQLQLRPVTTGGQGLLGLPRPGAPNEAPSGPQFPVTVAWPASGWLTAVLAVPLWLGWLHLTTRPILAGLKRQTRQRGLAGLAAIRAALGASHARRAGRFTRPELPWLRRQLAGDEAFGPELGYPMTPRDRRTMLRPDWEQMTRLIARSGWGKTTRLLVPIARRLPGPAVISSTEPAIFEQTVRARQCRRPTWRWVWLDHLMRRFFPDRQHPVRVVDFSDPDVAFAAGWPTVQWNPIVGSESFPVAYRRATALMHGTESGSDSDGDDSIFRGAAVDVLAVWLHAAALGDYELTHMQSWLRDTTDSQPRRILARDQRADPTAVDALDKHLDTRAERTTSGVERYLARAMSSLLSREGQQLAGRRFDEQGRVNAGQFDPVEFIHAGGTLYILASPALMTRSRPILTLIADEMFYAAEQAALRTRHRRLPAPFMGVFDEMRWGVSPSNLSYVATGLRKFGIGYIYAVQSSTQEDQVYGDDAQSLRDAAGVSIFGGIDITSARELTDRAGSTPVVTASRGHHFESEHIEHQDALTIADQQDLDDGEAVLLARGLRPFLSYTRSFYERPSEHKRITAEARDVATTVAAERAATSASQRARQQANDDAAEIDECDPHRNDRNDDEESE